MVLRNAILLVLVAVCGLSTDLSAQTLTMPAQRPVRGIFGRADNGDGLDVTVLTFQGYDDDRSGDTVNSVLGGSESRPTTNGPFSGLDVSLAYAKKAGRVSFGVGERSGVRYYSALNDLVGIQHDVAGGFSAELGRTQISVTQTVGYAPFYSFSTLPVLVGAQPASVAPPIDQLLVTRPSLTLSSTGNLSHTIGRATLSVMASTQRTDFTEESVTALHSDNVMGRFLYHLSRDLGLVAAYSVQRGRYALDPRNEQSYDFRNIQLGLDYDKALSISRRTKIGFTTGTTAVGESGAAGYRVVGDGRISREMGRTWLGTALYRRSVGMIAGFPQPIFTDGLALSLTGSASRRLTIEATGGYASGEMAAVAFANHSDNYNGSAQVQLALTRLLALSGGVSFYRYRFDNTVGLPLGIQQSFDRRTARVGLSLWLPLLR